MDFNYLPFIYFNNALVFAYLLIYILYKNPKSWINRSISVNLFCFFLWSIGSAILCNPEISKEQAIQASNIASIGWIWFSSFLLIFSLFFTNKHRITKSKIFYIVLFSLAAFFTYSQWMGKIVSDYALTDLGWVPRWSDSYTSLAFIAFNAVVSLLAIFNMLLHRKHTNSAVKKKQLTIIVSAGFIAFFTATFADIILPIFEIDSFNIIGDTAILTWAIGLVYAMVRYKFLEVTPALAAQNVLATMSDVMILIDMKGNVKSINNATINLLKYTEEELIGKSIDKIFTKRDFANKILYSAKNGKIINNEELSLRTRDKQGVPVIFSITVLRDEENDPVGIACLARDIVELKVAQEELKGKVRELKTSEKSISEAYNDLKILEKEIEGEHNRILAIISNFIDPIIFVNNNGFLHLINPAAKKVLGIKENAINEKISKTNNYALENFSKIITRKFLVLRGGETQFVGEDEEELEIEIDNQKFIYRVSTNKVLDKGYFLGTLKIFTNLTREKEIDKLKSDFITIAAHQLRTPLAAIKWVIKLILDEEAGKINDEQKGYLTKGYESNERVIGLVNDMLDVSRIEDGRFGYNFAKENFLETLDEVIESLKGQIEERHISLSVNAPDKVPLISLDRDKITLVLQNLLENAVKYSPEHGKVSVDVKIDNKFLKVSVKDNGVGVPEEDQKKIFTKFFRAQNVMRIQTEGSGLGLFIVRNIIKKHGGEISFKSVEGEGSEFIFEIPLNN